VANVAVQVIGDFVGELRRGRLVGLLDRRHRGAVVAGLKMAGAATLHSFRIRGDKNLRRQHDIAFGSSQRRLEARRGLVRVVTLDATQHRLTIRAVFLQRMVLVIERHLAVLVRLAVFPQRDLFRLGLAFLFLGENEGHTTECKQENEKYLHGVES